VGASLSNFFGMRAQPKPVYNKHAASPSKIACMVSDERGGQLMEMDGSLALRSSQVSDHRAFAREKSVHQRIAGNSDFLLDEYVLTMF